tara:strand:- start:54 stop:359 length:306 start_codon:yes stop_codon:yes gene_type:complete
MGKGAITMSEQLWMNILTGPVAALGLCLVLLYAIGKWAASNIPVWVDRHLKQIDKIVDSHNQDRAMYQENLKNLSISLGKVSVEVEVIKQDVQEIKTKIGK